MNIHFKTLSTIYVSEYAKIDIAFMEIHVIVLCLLKVLYLVIY